MLGFDVPTFVFQIINFLILLAILARFFYRPVLEVMAKRQAQIDARIEDAEQRARQADEEREKLAQQSETAAREAAALLESARTDAARERQRILDAAKADAAALIDEARTTAAAEEQAAIGRLSSRLSQSTVRIAGALIRDASGEAVHQALVDRLLSDGFGLDEEAQEQARLDFHEKATPLVIESAYALDASQEQALQQQAAHVLGQPPEKVQISVREDPELVAGVRVLLGSLVIDMSLKHELDQLGGQESAR